jgi:hypothetical protein
VIGVYMDGKHDVALWSGVAAFFGSLLAVGIFDVFDADQAWEYLGAFLVAGITAGSVYAKQRLDDAKKNAQDNVAYQKSRVKK